MMNNTRNIALPIFSHLDSKPMKPSFHFRLATALLAGCLWSLPTYAADTKYPEKPVTIIVPYGAGGVADVLPRMVGQRLGEKWNVPVIIENKPGASGNIGMAQAARAKPDGYTLALAPTGNLTTNPTLYRQLPFDTAKDFTPVTLLGMSPNVLVVNSQVKANTLAELVAYAKANPDQLNYSSPGAGSGAHLAGELLKQETGAAIVHIPYNGMAQAVNDVIAGNVHLMFAGVSTVLPQIKAGKLKAIAVAGPDRLPQLPDLPTVAESGYPGFDVTSWYGIVAPSKVPAPILDKLQRDIAEILKEDSIKEKFMGLGVVATPTTRDEFAKLIASDTKKWTDIIKTAGIEPIQ